MRRTFVVLAVALLPALVPLSVLQAQRSARTAFAPAIDQTAPETRLVLPAPAGISAKRHVWIGALAGMAAMAIGIAIYMGETSEENLAGPIAFVPAVLVAGVVGGALGYVVYRIRR